MTELADLYATSLGAKNDSIADHTHMSPPTPANKNSVSDKPYFVLHIGPPKSATTAIQCGLERISGELARQDGYFYLGNACIPGQSIQLENGVQSIKMFDFVANLNERRGTNNGGNESTFLRDAESLLLYHRRRGHNLVMSSEHFISRMKESEDVWKDLSNLLDGFQVKIVVGYRHYAQWIPSMYYQRNQGEPYLKWPHEGGLTYPSFEEYLEQHLNQWDASGRDNLRDRDSTHHSLWALLTWSKHFRHKSKHVAIFDLQQRGDTLTNFVCTMLPSADYTCRLLQDYVKTNGRTVVKRVSSNFHAERLTEAAYMNGMLQHGSFKALPVHVAKYMMRLTRIHENPTLWTCLSQSLEGRFRDASRTFMDLVYTASGKNLTDNQWRGARLEHDASFERTKVLGRFCDINPVAVLRNTTLTEQIFGRFFNGTDRRKSLSIHYGRG